MSNWKKERIAVLNWWPQLIYGTKNKGSLFVDSLEDAAWGCNTKEDWDNWFLQVEKIWPEYNLLEPLYHNRDGEGIDIHLGPTLGISIMEKIYYELDLLELKTLANEVPSKISISNEISVIAKQLVDDFGIKEIVASKSCEEIWLSKQLRDTLIGFSNLASILNIPNKNIGLGELRLYYHEKSSYRGAICSTPKHIEIHQHSGNFAQAWAIWRFSYNKNSDYTTTINKWKKSWVKTHRTTLEHQIKFLEKSQHSYKKLVEKIPVTSEMGQKIFRRYRATCKWIDELQKGFSLEYTRQSWDKLKTGNKISWSNETNGKYQKIIDLWIWEEKLIEVAFWRAPQWHIPSWVQRFRALKHDNWIINEEQFREDDYVKMWSLGFEKIVYEGVGYDSWLAIKDENLPNGFEYNQWNDFFRKNIIQHLK